MIPEAFEYVAPKSVEEALRLLEQGMQGLLQADPRLRG